MFVSTAVAPVRPNLKHKEDDESIFTEHQDSSRLCLTMEHVLMKAPSSTTRTAKKTYPGLQKQAVLP
jgi:hypothetical protein